MRRGAHVLSMLIPMHVVHIELSARARWLLVVWCGWSRQGIKAIYLFSYPFIPYSFSLFQSLSDAGLVFDKFVLLDVPDEVLIDRVSGRRIDPETGKIYHLTFNPPESDEIKERCVQRADDTEEKMKVRLENYHGNVSGDV